MKTIYLLGWLTSAILLAIYGMVFKEAIVLYIFNAVIPVAFLLIRMVTIHCNVDESKIYF